jgi:hypothetical protein
MIWKIIIYGHQEICFPERAGMTFVIGQNRKVIEVSFGLSENSLEAHLSKVKRHARFPGVSSIDGAFNVI